MALPTRPTYLMNVYEKLGTPLLSAVVEAIEREALMNAQGSPPPQRSDTEEAERMAGLLKSSAELGLALSRQVDLRMLEATDADGVRLTLATLAAPLVANLYRVNGRVPTTLEVDRMVSAMQAVTVFSDHYNAAADATTRIQGVDQDFAPMDATQVQLALFNALMPAVNAICTFSFGQLEKNLLQDVTTRLTTTAERLRKDLFSELPERESLRAEIALLRAIANIYSQAHFMEMSKLMFLDETQRDRVNLGDRLAELWRVVDHRLSMVRVLAEHLVSGRTSSGSGSGSAATAPSVAPAHSPTTSTSGEPSAMMPTTPVQPAGAPPSATASAPGGGSPFSAFSAPKAPASAGSVPPTVPPATPAGTATMPVASVPSPATAPGDKSNPLSMFAKPKESAGGQG